MINIKVNGHNGFGWSSETQFQFVFYQGKCLLKTQSQVLIPKKIALQTYYLFIKFRQGILEIQCVEPTSLKLKIKSVYDKMH